MKIIAHVTSVSDSGDKLTVVAQGIRPTDADWRPMLKFEFEMHATAANQKAMHVGRKFEITVKPK